MRAVLVGNQNCGKTTLFNLLTGLHQKIGNWPGVTVTRKSGIIENLEMELIDLPGTYSLSPYSLEEKITCGFLMNEEYDLIINVVDVTTLKRGLFLTSELGELNKKMIVVLNMVDKLESKGLTIHIDKLRKCLKVDVCLIAASCGTGIVDLLKIIRKNTMELKRNIKEKRIAISNFDDEKEIMRRYQYIDEIYYECVKEIKRRNSIHIFLDNLFLNKFLSIPIFAIIMFGIYYLSIEIFGKYVSFNMTQFINILRDMMANALKNLEISKWIISLLCDGIIPGVGSVLSFLPQLAMIFLFTSFLEASGYMARVSFMFDKLLRKCGLNGKSLIPFILGTGCSVSGLMATKIIENEEERIHSIITTPFIPCSAKLPIITLFTSYFFTSNYALIAVSFYFLSILLIILSSLIMKKIFYKNKNELYIFELPEYQLPKWKLLYKDVKAKVFEFISKAGTTIFIASLLVWFFLSFSTSLKYGVDINDSILAFWGEKISCFFVPIIGVKSWEVSVSAIQGLIAKEQVISSMEIITGMSGKIKNTFEIFSINSPFYFFRPASAYAFTAFNLFTTPCIATITAMWKELKNYKYFLLALGYQVIIGWGVAASLFCLLNYNLSE